MAFLFSNNQGNDGSRTGPGGHAEREEEYNALTPLLKRFFESEFFDEFIAIT